MEEGAPGCPFVVVANHVKSKGCGKNAAGPDQDQGDGAACWNAFLAWAGYTLKDNWEEVMRYSAVIDIAVLALLVLAAAFFVWTHLKRRRKNG